MDASLIALSSPNPSLNIVGNGLSSENTSQLITNGHEKSEQLNSTHDGQRISSNAAYNGVGNEKQSMHGKFNDDSHSDILDVDMPPSSSQPEHINRKKRKASGDRRWTTDFLLQNPKSCLVNADLLTILKNERAWFTLSSDQQKKLVSLLPNGSDLICEIEDQKSNFLKKCLMSNSAFQSDVRMFQEDLAEGRLQPARLAKAKAAMERRSRGDFDEWKEEETERFWGQKQRIDYRALAGESSKVKIEDLISSGYFQVNDRWLYIRTIHKKGKGSILVEKEAKLVSISGGSQLNFSFPPGQNKYSSSKSGNDLTVECKRGPNSLAVAIVEEACNIKNWRPGNAWKEFRCLRKNQDMGSPWEIRELFYNRHGLSSGAEK